MSARLACRFNLVIMAKILSSALSVAINVAAASD